MTWSRFRQSQSQISVQPQFIQDFEEMSFKGLVQLSLQQFVLSMVSYLTGQGYFGSCWVGKRLSPCIGRSERTPPYTSSSMAHGSYLFLEASIAPATFAAAKFGVRSSGHNHGRFPPLLPYTVSPMMIVHSKTTTSHCIIHTIFA